MIVPKQPKQLTLYRLYVIAHATIKLNMNIIMPNHAAISSIAQYSQQLK